MRRVAATEAKNRLGAILDAAQLEPIVIQRQDRDIAVVLSMSTYESLRSASVRELLNLADQMSTEAAERGLDESRLARLLSEEDA